MVISWGFVNRDYCYPVHERCTIVCPNPTKTLVEIFKQQPPLLQEIRAREEKPELRGAKSRKLVGDWNRNLSALGSPNSRPVALRNVRSRHSLISNKRSMICVSEIAMCGSFLRSLTRDGPYYPSSHNHGSEKWGPAIVITFQIQPFSTSRIVGERVTEDFLCCRDTTSSLTSFSSGCVCGCLSTYQPYIYIHVDLKWI